MAAWWLNFQTVSGGNTQHRYNVTYSSTPQQTEMLTKWGADLDHEVSIVPTISSKIGWKTNGNWRKYRPLPLLQLLVSETSSFRRSFFDRSYSTCTPLYANWGYPLGTIISPESRICGLRMYKKWQKRRGMRRQRQEKPLRALRIVGLRSRVDVVDN
jgi:hypothetical protein